MIAILGSLPAGEFVSPVFGTLLCLRFKSWNFFFFEDHLSLSWLLHHLARLRLHLPWLFHSLSPFCLFALSIFVIISPFLPLLSTFSVSTACQFFVTRLLLGLLNVSFSLNDQFTLYFFDKFVSVSNLFYFSQLAARGLGSPKSQCPVLPRCQLSQHQSIARVIYSRIHKTPINCLCDPQNPQ